jgi:hypothetical protein
MIFKIIFENPAQTVIELMKQREVLGKGLGFKVEGLEALYDDPTMISCVA